MTHMLCGAEVRRFYRKYNSERDEYPAFRDVETDELYSSIYARIIIKNKKPQK